MATSNGFNGGPTGSEKSTVDAYRDAARDAGQQLAQTAQARTEELRTQAQAGLETAKVRARELSGEAETMVRERPWVALGVAALAGIVVAKLLS